MHRERSIAAAVALAATLCTVADAGFVPATEEFDVDNANWADALFGPADWIAGGGPGGPGDAYISTSFNFGSSLEGDQPALLRAQDEFNSSGNAFVGNWIAEGVTEFSFSIRHDGPAPLTFFTRFSGPANFPGAAAIEFMPVLPGTWTQITIPITADNPQFVTFENSDFDTVFSLIGHIQVGLQVPAFLAGVDQDITFDLDDVTIVPAPGAAALLLLVAAGARRRRPR